MKLVPDWRDARRWYSMHGMAAGAVLSAFAGSVALAGSAAAWFTVFDLGIVLILAAVIFVASMAGRLIDQTGKTRFSPTVPKPKSNAGMSTQ